MPVRPIGGGGGPVKTIAVKVTDEIHKHLVELAEEDDRALVRYCSRVLTAHASDAVTYVDMDAD